MIRRFFSRIYQFFFNREKTEYVSAKWLSDRRGIKESNEQ